VACAVSMALFFISAILPSRLLPSVTSQAKDLPIYSPAAVANACELDVPHDGLVFPPCGADALASVLRPKALGGVLAGDGVVEVVSSLKRDGQPVERDLRWGVYVVFKAQSDYAAACFKQYGLPTDATGRYAAMYKPFHLIGLELPISVLNVALRGEPTGSCRGWRGDAVTVAKRALTAGEMLDGEGGYCVYAKLIPAARSLKLGALPIGLAHHVKLVRSRGHVVFCLEESAQRPAGRLAADAGPQPAQPVAAHEPAPSPAAPPPAAGTSPQSPPEPDRARPPLQFPRPRR